MNDHKPEKVQLWLEGWRVFRRTWQLWIKWAIWFWVILVGLEFWLLHDSGPYYAAFNLILKTHAPDMAAQFKTLPDHSNIPPLLMVLVGLAEYYIFNIFYLSQAPILHAPKPGGKAFIYMLIKVIQKYLVIVGLLLLVFIPLVLIAAFVVKFFHTNAGVFILAIAFPFALIYLTLRYSMVPALATEQITSSLKISAQLVRDNIWRVLGCYITIWGVGMLVVFVTFGINWLATDYRYWDDHSVTALLALIISTLSVLVSGISSAFLCTACRILYQEKTRTDPSFTLKTRT